MWRRSVEACGGLCRPVSSAASSPSVIKVPLFIERCAKRRQRRRELVDEKRHTEQRELAARGGKRSHCIISCRDPRLNHYLGQTYPRHSTPALCCQHWRRSKWNGDHFTVHSQQQFNDSRAAIASTGRARATFSSLGLDTLLVNNLKTMGIEHPTEIQRACVCSLLRDGGKMTGANSSCTVLAGHTGCGKTLAFLLPLAHQLLQAHSHSTDLHHEEYDEELASRVCDEDTGDSDRDPHQEHDDEEHDDDDDGDQAGDEYCQQLAGNNTASNEQYNSPRAIIITPGRELATQIKDVCERLLSGSGLSVSLLLGTGMRRRMLNLQPGRMDILVASLGALNKMVSSKLVNVRRVEHVVLDESDTLLDDSFCRDTQRILSRLNLRPALNSRPVSLTDRHTRGTSSASIILAAATVPRELPAVLENVVSADQICQISTDQLHQLQPNLEHRFMRVNSREKADILVQMCRAFSENQEKTIVFSNTHQCASFVWRLMNDHGLSCICLSANMSPRVRAGRWLEFLHATGHQHLILSCTDVVSRGLDPVNVQNIVNFEFPWNVSDYIHRAGRAGRANTTPYTTTPYTTTPHTTTPYTTTPYTTTKTPVVTSLINRPMDVVIAQRIELAVRRSECLKTVDANIKRIIENRKNHKSRDLR